jgi:type IV pilus assembly protein PilB
MILVTGPTGSGKTTTLYTMLQQVDTDAKKVITLEDPIEYNLPGISQSQIQEDKEYDFASGLRAILRQDPDVIMVGEIRDLETAETAAQASLTGHLVISTLHTNSAVESIPRLVNMGLKSFILAPALDLIIAQRLVRKLCDHCAEARPITETERAHISEQLEKMKAKGIEAPPIPETIKHNKGCEVCGNSGFKGQVAIAEVLRFNEGLRNLILEGKPMPELYGFIDRECGMLSLHEDGILKVLRGMTTLEEVERVAA